MPLTADNQKRERQVYVKLVSDLPNRRTASRVVRVRRNRGNRGMDWTSFVCSLSRSVSGFAPLWAEKGRLTEDSLDRKEL
jgi:hypothetical protein